MKGILDRITIEGSCARCAMLFRPGRTVVSRVAPPSARRVRQKDETWCTAGLSPLPKSRFDSEAVNPWKYPPGSRSVTMAQARLQAHGFRYESISAASRQGRPETPVSYELHSLRLTAGSCQKVSVNGTTSLASVTS